jgi:O-antigen/teichoic acid export membrane protein
MHRFRADSILSVSDKLLMILICGALLYLPPWKEHFQIEWFIDAQIASYLISSLLAFIVCSKLTQLKWHRFHPAKAWTIAKKSLPFAVLIFSMSIYLRADSVILERILPNGKEEAGIFAASFRLLDVANNMTGVLFAGMLLPMFGRLLAKRETVRPLVRQSLNLLLPVALTTLVLAGFFGNEIMHLLYTEATGYDGKVFFLLMCSFPGFCIGYVYATLITANGQLRPLIYISLMAVVVNLLLNFILIPAYGAVGAAISCAATQCLLSILNIRLARKLIQLNWDWKWILQYVIFGVWISTTGWLIYQWEGSLLLKILGVGIAGIAGMVICGFIPLRKAMEVLRGVASSE